MKIICLTSNKYHHVVPGFAHLFNKFWSENQEVTVVGYEAPRPPLPRNFRWLSLGKQDDFTWSSGLMKLCSLLTESHVLLFLEDYYLSKPVNTDLIANLYNYLLSNPEIVKLDLTDDRGKLEHTAWADSDAPTPLILSGPETLFQTSTQAALWERRFLWRFLSEKETAWEYEKKGSKRIIEARKRGTFDGLILGCQNPPVQYINAIGGEGGHPQVWARKRFPIWMSNDLLAHGLLPGWGNEIPKSETKDNQ